MNPERDETWEPTPEMLAAFFDGEFEGRDEVASLRKRLEGWLAENPKAQEELAEYRRLRQFWLDTTPAEPQRDQWDRVQSRLECFCPAPVVSRSPERRARPWMRALLLLGAACVLVGFILFANRPHNDLRVTIPEDEAPYPVAAEHEVVILRVEGADTNTIVVGLLPIKGLLELLGPGEVTFTSVQPHERDSMVPQVHVTGQGRPMIWALAGDEEDEP